MLGVVRAAILNSGQGSWAFAALADQLSVALWIDVVAEPAEMNYVLYDDASAAVEPTSFIPRPAVEVAADKRTQTVLFADAGVPRPETVLLDSADAVRQHLRHRTDRRWVLKYPIGAGAAGHRLLDADAPLPDDWPQPFIVQEFIEMTDPVVFRTYGAGGDLFGWNVRRFPSGSARRSPFVAHATGARYDLVDDPPREAVTAAERALDAAGLAGSFGCVDLLPSPQGWLVIEVGTDGYYNHVDREVPEPLATDLDRCIAVAFWEWIGDEPPWGATWHPATKSSNA